MTDYLWLESDFENYREELKLKLLKKPGPKEIEEPSFEQLVLMLTKKYGQDIIVSNERNHLSNERNPKKPEDYSLEEITDAIIGLNYDLPKEVLMHLTYDEMFSLLSGIGRMQRNNWEKFLMRYFYSGESVIQILSRLASQRLDNPNLFRRPSYPVREEGLIYNYKIDPRQIRELKIDGKNRDFNRNNVISYLKEKSNAKKEETKRHHHLKELLRNRFKGISKDIFFEVQLNRFICVDAIGMEENKFILYEVKSSPHDYEKGIEQLHNAGLFFYYNFGIIPELRLRYSSYWQVIEETISFPEVNPIYRGNLKVEFKIK